MAISKLDEMILCAFSLIFAPLRETLAWSRKGAKGNIRRKELF